VKKVAPKMFAIFSLTRSIFTWNFANCCQFMSTHI